MTTESVADWRPIFAALANDDMRRVYSEVMLERAPIVDPTVQQSARTRRAVEALRRVGLIEEEDGVLVARSDPFSNALRAQAPDRPDGIGRFLRDGRIVQYPARPSDRMELLRWVADQALEEGETLSEQAVNARLSAFHDDPAVLRRYLVDAGLVDRDRAGSAYERKPTVRAEEETTVSRHVIRAERAAKYWVISIDGVVRTQAKREREIEVMARDWLALMNEREPESFELEIDVTHARAAGGRFSR